jgi:hypothetical protein
LKPPAVFIIQAVTMMKTGTLRVSLEMDPNNTLTYI